MELSQYDTFLLPIPNISNVYARTSSIPIPLILALQPTNLTLSLVPSYPPLQLLLTLKTPYRPIYMERTEHKYLHSFSPV